jgi:gluconolactonase
MRLVRIPALLLALFALPLLAQPAPPVVSPGATLETLFEEGVFTEGPAAAPDGTVYFSDITGSARSKSAGHIMRYDPRGGAVSVYRSPSGMANGIIFDLEGRMVVAEGADFGGRRVTRTEMASGRSESLASLFEGRHFNSPNDVTIDARGRIYFSDPRYVGHEPIEMPVMAVYRIDPDGAVRMVVSDAGKPNGLAVSPDQKTLYVASGDNGATGALPKGMAPLPGRSAILAYDLAEDGTTKLRSVLAPQGADGLTVDTAGNVYAAAGSKGVLVYSPEGREIAQIATPVSTTNVEFSRGEGPSYLYITGGKGLYRIRVDVRGYHPADK